MNYRRLGHSGLKVSELSLGAWITYGGQVGEDAARECMTAGYDAGVNFFDNAEAYAHGAAETIMGNVIRKTGWRRSSLVVSTKFYFGLGLKGPNDRGLSRKRLMEGIHGSLRRLQMDYVDLIFAHRPDPETPIEETVRAMHDIVTQGKALYWGTSEWTADEIVQAHAAAERHHLHKPQMEQPQYNMFWRERVERQYARLYTEIGLGLTTWSPLLLTGKYNEEVPAGSRLALKGMEWLREEVVTPERIEKVKRLAMVARNLGMSTAQFAIAWCLKNPNVSSVITGATRVEQVRENLKAADLSDRLTPDAMERIEKVLGNRPESVEPE
ncbi:MAG: aldo/keto reductase [Nitrospirae bacterium]|nr:aldo/keto reductase [Nitrospirota bacterium]